MGHEPISPPSLARITAPLLDPSDDFPSITEATSSLFQLLTDINSLDREHHAQCQPVLLPSGKGIGTFWAALCIQDVLRTKRFVRGLFEAIRKAQLRFPGTTIHVLYAGTGPFATLALPMTTVFSPEEVRFTLLEIHPASVSMLHNTIEHFAIEAYVKDVVHADAATYLPAEDVHILVSETMQRALDKEPQVAITQHLVPFLHPDGFLVPEEIVIRAGLLNPAMESTRQMDFVHPPEHYIKYLDDILVINKETLSSYSNTFPIAEITIAPTLINGYSALNLFTLIRVFDQVQLSPWQSGLTLPKSICRLDPRSRGKETHTFQYQIGSNPGFIHHVPNPTP